MTLHAVKHDPEIEVDHINADINALPCDRGVLIGIRQRADGQVTTVVDPVSPEARDQTSYEAWIGLTFRLVEHWGVDESTKLHNVLDKIIGRAKQGEGAHRQ